MEAGRRKIHEIFTGMKVLEIPYFQRSYVWEEEQWDRLLEDLYEICSTNTTHFFGSVILKQRKTGMGEKFGDRRIVIDGQQRLTTLNIFFKVLCLKQNLKTDFERTFKLTDGQNALINNHNDIESFNTILGLEKIKDIDKKDKITLCYQYFCKNIDQKRLNYNIIFNNIVFIVIELEDYEEEQQIFDTINSLGVKLTTAELLKNYFFNKDNYEMYETYWKNIFEADEETRDYWEKEITTGRIKRTILDLFLFAYLQIKINEKTVNIKNEDKLGFNRVEHLFQSYKLFIKDYCGGNQNIIIKELKDYAVSFKNNLNPIIDNEELTAEAGIERINVLIFGLENTTLIPYVLYILKEVDDIIQRNELFEHIESFIMRRMIVRTTNKNYNQLFSDRLISNEKKSKNEFINYLNTQADKTNYMPDNKELKEAFHNSVLINKNAAGVIYLIETKIREKKLHSTKLLGINKYSLEHLMPKKWENNWDQLTEKSEVYNRNRKLLTLGNLAIITQNLNAKIRDSNWETKKNGANNDGLIAYTGGIETITPYLQLDIWNEDTIEKRANDLYDHALVIWKE